MPDTTHHFYSKLTCRYNFQNYSGLRVPQLFRGLLRVERNFSEGENELKSESNEELPIKADSFFFFFMLLFLLYFFFFSFLLFFFATCTAFSLVENRGGVIPLEVSFYPHCHSFFLLFTQTHFLRHRMYYTHVNLHNLHLWCRKPTDPTKLTQRNSRATFFNKPSRWCVFNSRSL